MYQRQNLKVGCMTKVFQYKQCLVSKGQYLITWSSMQQDWLLLPNNLCFLIKVFQTFKGCCNQYNLMNNLAWAEWEELWELLHLNSKWDNNFKWINNKMRCLKMIFKCLHMNSSKEINHPMISLERALSNLKEIISNKKDSGQWPA